MVSENLGEKRLKKEESLYVPIMNTVRVILAYNYVEKEKKYQHQLDSSPNPYLEITALGNFSERLKNLFDYYLFKNLSAELLKPDITGFVKKTSSSNPERVTVEVKATVIKIKDVLQAKLYQDIFGAKFSLVISPKGISAEKLEVVLKYDKKIRGNVIIAKFVRPYPQIEEGCIYVPPKLEKLVPAPFNKFLDNQQS